MIIMMGVLCILVRHLRDSSQAASPCKAENKRHRGSTSFPNNIPPQYTQDVYNKGPDVLIGEHVCSIPTSPRIRNQRSEVLFVMAREK